MKIRNGFVSNSSSSSFILGYGLVKPNDIEKLESYCRQHKIEFAKEVDTYADVKIIPCWHLDKSYRILSCTNHTELIIPQDIEYEQGNIVIFEIGNDEGDYAFADLDSEYGDLDWDRAKDKTFWSGWQRAVIDLFDTDILVKEYSEILYGAERNG